jgi:hypothetical protein
MGGFKFSLGDFRSDSPSSGYMTCSDVFPCFSIPALFEVSLDSAQLQITGEYKLQIEVHTNYGIVNLA